MTKSSTGKAVQNWFALAKTISSKEKFSDHKIIQRGIRRDLEEKCLGNADESLRLINQAS
jgi:hypothetical protein